MGGRGARIPNKILVPTRSRTQISRECSGRNEPNGVPRFARLTNRNYAVRVQTRRVRGNTANGSLIMEMTEHRAFGSISNSGKTSGGVSLINSSNRGGQGRSIAARYQCGRSSRVDDRTFQFDLPIPWDPILDRVPSKNPSKKKVENPSLEDQSFRRQTLSLLFLSILD